MTVHRTPRVHHDARRRGVPTPAQCGGDPPLWRTSAVLLGERAARRIHHRRNLVDVGAHGRKAERTGSGRMNRIVAFPDAFQVEHLLEQQGERGVGRVDHDGLAADVVVGLDLRAHDQLVQAGAAARETMTTSAFATSMRARALSTPACTISKRPFTRPSRCASEFRVTWISTERPRLRKAFFLGDIQRQVLRGGMCPSFAVGRRCPDRVSRSPCLPPPALH